EGAQAQQREMLPIGAEGGGGVLVLPGGERTAGGLVVLGVGDHEAAELPGVRFGPHQVASVGGPGEVANLAAAGTAYLPHMLELRGGDGLGRILLPGGGGGLRL